MRKDIRKKCIDRQDHIPVRAFLYAGFCEDRTAKWRSDMATMNVEHYLRAVSETTHLQHGDRMLLLSDPLSVTCWY